MDVQSFLREITSSNWYQDQIQAIKTIPSLPPKYEDSDLGPILEPLLKRSTIKRLYSHQATALKMAREKLSNCFRYSKRQDPLL